jgi:hypothetical protein
VRLTQRLTAALVEHRHLRSKRVLGRPVVHIDAAVVQNRMRLAAKRAKRQRPNRAGSKPFDD